MPWVLPIIAALADFGDVLSIRTGLCWFWSNDGLGS